MPHVRVTLLVRQNIHTYFYLLLLIFKIHEICNKKFKKCETGPKNKMIPNIKHIYFLLGYFYGCVKLYKCYKSSALFIYFVKQFY